MDEGKGVTQVGFERDVIVKSASRNLKLHAQKKKKEKIFNHRTPCVQWFLDIGYSFLHYLDISTVLYRSVDDSE